MKSLLVRCRLLVSPGLIAAGFVTLAFASLAQDLTVTAGLQLWLKADAGVTATGAGLVTAWQDQSPAANNAAQFDESWAPTRVNDALNGKPVLRFDGVDDFLEVADSESLSIGGDLTSFFVVRFEDFVGYQAVWAKTAVNFPAPTDYYTLPGSGVPRLYRGDGTGTGLGSFDGAALRAGTYLIVGFDSSGQQVNHYLAAQPTRSGTIAVTPLDGDQSLYIGTRGDFFTKLKGDLAEVLIYDRALSPTERSTLVDYLAAKYGIQNLPPTIALTVDPAGPNLAVGGIVSLTATAADPDGTVARVEFLAGGSVVATATAPPYRARVRFDTAGTFELSARVVDDKDASAVSASFSFTAGPATTPSLTSTNNLQLWLSAGAGVTTAGAGAVTQWVDQSGKGNNALQTDEAMAPTLVANAVNGQPALRFDGTDDYLDVADSDSLSIAGDLTSLFVVKMDDFATFRAVWGKTQVNQPAPTDYYLLPSSGTPRLYRGNAAGSLGFSDGGAAFRAGTFELAGFASAGGTTAHYLNGQTTSTGTIAATPADLDTPLKIGTREDFVTRLKGDLAELLIYDVALSATDLIEAQLYLAGKYGIGILTPTNTPPVAAITSPLNGATVASPTNLTIEATASDPDGSIVRVEFLWNGAVVATRTVAPYQAVLALTAADEANLSVRAIDNLGGSFVSPVVSYRATSTQVIALPAAAHLKLWLKADAGVTVSEGAVSGWEDQSGNLNHAGQTNAVARPVVVESALNGKPAIRFDGVDDFLSVAHAFNLGMVQDLSSFFVIAMDDFATFRAAWAKTAGNQPRANDFYVLPDTGIPRGIRGGVGAGSVDGTNPLTAGTYAIVGFDMAGTTFRHFLNGAVNGEGQITVPLQDAGTPLLIGTRQDQVTRLSGGLAELVIYNSALSDADRSAVISYLGEKYGIPVETIPVLTLTRTGDTITLTWPAATVGFTLETTANLVSGTWQTVPNVTGNSVTLPLGAGPAYFRLLGP